MPRYLVEQQPDAPVGIPRRRERRVRRQPEEIVGVEMGDIDLSASARPSDVVPEPDAPMT